MESCNVNKAIAKTKEDNQRFAKANKARKRVMIAKDVIAAVKGQQIMANAGIYILSDRFLDALYFNPEESLQQLFPKIPACKACAKGSLFICTIMRRNKLKVNEVPSLSGPYAWIGNALASKLGNIFDADQLNLIENFFESKEINRVNGYGLLDYYKLKGCFSHEDRLIKIMENIIANKGTFVPEKL